jgi:MFS family permease
MVNAKSVLSGRINAFVEKNTLVNIVLISNAFVWYFFVISILKNAIGALQIDYLTTVLIWSAHYGGIAFSAILGYKLLRKFADRKKFLEFWMIFGVVASMASILIDKTIASNVLVLSAVLGVSLGVGMPCCMAYFTEKVKIEKRGSVGGLVLLLSGVCVVFLGMLSSGNLFMETSILTAWRLLGLTVFVLLKTTSENIDKSKALSYRQLSSQRSFVLYFLPWLMFSLIVYLTIPIQSEIVGKSTVEFFTIIESGLLGIFAFIGGFLVDILGRKRVAIAGFVMLGLGYSILGLFFNDLRSWYFYTVIDGVALGLLYVVFVVTIWGDLSPTGSSDKCYAIGVLPFFISQFIEYIIGGNEISFIPKSAIFSFTAFFLFLAVLPLAYAPETLPEKLMKDRDLKSYVEKAMKKVQVETGIEKTVESFPRECNVEFQVKSDESAEAQEEAERLAEKYY